MSVCLKAESSVVWCGVVWCGVVWCGVVWCGVVWCGVVWCGVVWYGVVWCGVVWCAVVLSVLLCGVRLGHCGLGPGCDQVPAMDTAPSKQLVRYLWFQKTFHHIFVQ